MRWFQSVAAILAGAMLASPLGAFAQQATPEIGTEIPYLELDGDEIGTVTVLDVVDPFDDFSEFFDPEEGTRYVMVEVQVRSIDDDIEVNPYDFGLLTSDGFLYRPAFVSRPEGGGGPLDLENTELEEGDDVSGAVFFAVPEEAELGHLTWAPEFDRLLLLLDLGSE